MIEIVEKIKSRGYWEVIIRPSDFRKDRIPELQELKRIVTQSAVMLRGWDFPHMDSRNPIQLGVDWVQQKVDWSTHVEHWRFYQSGQFHYLGSIHDDWLDQSIWGKSPENWQVGAFLSITDTVFRFTEVFEFAARLAMTEASGELMNINITLSGLKNRRLRMDNPTRAWFGYEYDCFIESFPQKISVSRQELVGESKSLALKASQQLFMRFNWTPAIEVLRGMQEELRW